MSPGIAAVHTRYVLHELTPGRSGLCPSETDGQDWVKVEAKGLRDRLSPSGVLQTWVLVRRDDYDGRIYSGVET